MGDTLKMKECDTMRILVVEDAKVKYNRPDELVRSMNCAFASWDAAQ